MTNQNVLVHLTFRVTGVLQEQLAYMNYFSSTYLVDLDFSNGVWKAIFEAQSDVDGLYDVYMDVAEHLWEQGAQVVWFFDECVIVHEDGKQAPLFPLAVEE